MQFWSALPTVTPSLLAVALGRQLAYPGQAIVVVLVVLDVVAMNASMHRYRVLAPTDAESAGRLVGSLLSKPMPPKPLQRA
jgi:hypothetical protein